MSDRRRRKRWGDFRAGSLNTLVQMVAGGIGITLLPQLALDVECPHPVIHRHPPVPQARAQPHHRPGVAATVPAGA